MKKVILILFCSVSQYLIAQKNTVYFELGGNGLIGSFNYEIQISREPGLSGHVGVGYLPEMWNDPALVLPIGFFYLEPLKKSNYLEFGLGGTVITSFTSSPCGFSFFGQCDEPSETGANTLLIPSFGYRKYFGKDTSWMWKITFTPVVGEFFKDESNLLFAPWAGFSFGKRF